MGNRIIVDTYILIDVDRSKKESIKQLEDIERDGVAAICVVTQMELVVGCCNKRERQRLDGFLKRFEIVSLNPETACYENRRRKRSRLPNTWSLSALRPSAIRSPLSKTRRIRCDLNSVPQPRAAILSRLLMAGSGNLSSRI